MPCLLGVGQALRTSFSDKTPEVRGGLALCLMGLIRSADDFSSVSIDSLLTLGLKGLEDGAGGGVVKVQLLFAEAIAHFLALSVAGQALESKAKIIKSARGETEDAEAAKADAAGSSSSSSGVEKAMAKLKDIGGGPKRSASSSTSFTFESAVQYLISLFLKAAAGAPFSQGGIAAVLVAFLRRQKDSIREDTMQVGGCPAGWLVAGWLCEPLSPATHTHDCSCLTLELPACSCVASGS